MKCKLNFWINVVIYLLMGVMLFSGFLMKFTMPPGTGGKLTLLGFDRHGWGVLHFWVAVALLVGVVLHLWLHWSWVRTTTKQYWLRAAVPALAILFILALAAFAAPFALRPEQVPGGGEGLQYQGGRGAMEAELHAPIVDAGKITSEPAGDPCQSCASASSCTEEGAAGEAKDKAAGESSDAGKSGDGSKGQVRFRGGEGA